MAIALPKDRPVNFEADSAQRYLLSPGDQFFVPPNNVYRLENHSNLKACKLFWAIIKVRRAEHRIAPLVCFLLVASIFKRPS